VKLVVGLGNPGRRYAGTRHNIGFEVVDLLAARHGAGWESAPAEALIARWRASSVVLVKPLTFMNLSGQAVGDLLRFYKIDCADLLVVVDDVNLALGRLRARPGGSAGGHNGLKSLIGLLGTDGFGRIRIGVGGGEPQRDLAGHVLGRFLDDERSVVQEATLRAADAVELWVAEGMAPVMNRYNVKKDTEGTKATDEPGKEDGP
jgi:peptidyl-tRNA hydrolase, PTH1 family